jgi:hypothetical protein
MQDRDPDSERHSVDSGTEIRQSPEADAMLERGEQVGTGVVSEPSRAVIIGVGAMGLAEFIASINSSEEGSKFDLATLDRILEFAQAHIVPLELWPHQINLLKMMDIYEDPRDAKAGRRPQAGRVPYRPELHRGVHRAKVQNHRRPGGRRK